MNKFLNIKGHKFQKINVVKVQENYIRPIDPAVKPTAKKNVNSNKSLGRELTNKFI